MVNNKKIISILVILLCLGTLFIAAGCGKSKTTEADSSQAKSDTDSKKPKMTAVDSAKFFYNFYLKQDKTDIEKFGIKDDEAERTIQSGMNETKDRTKMNFQSNGMPITDEQANNIVQAQYDALKKLNYTVEENSESENEANVTITTPYIDFKVLDTKAANDAQNTVSALGIKDRTELLNKLKDQYVQNLISEFKNASHSSETQKGTYDFKIDSQLGTWVPDMSEDKFDKELVNLVQTKK